MVELLNKQKDLQREKRLFDVDEGKLGKGEEKKEERVAKRTKVG